MSEWGWMVLSFYGKAKYRMNEGGFKLQTLLLNSRELMKLFNESQGNSEVPQKSVLEKDKTSAASVSGPFI